jgi:hypothetical protein
MVRLRPIHDTVDLSAEKTIRLSNLLSIRELCERARSSCANAGLRDGDFWKAKNEVARGPES